MDTREKYPLSEQLAATSLMHDARIAEAKRLLHAAVSDHKKGLTGIRPALPDLKQSYETLLADIAKFRGSKLWFPYLGSGFGNGPLVELADGSVKYDFICGIGPHFFGHSHPDLIDAAIDASVSNTIMQGNLQQNVDSLELSALLVEAAGIDHCFLTSSGAMANENALKIAFQKHHPACRVLAFDHCFAGRSLTTSQITDRAIYREGLPTNVFIDYVPFFDASRPEESTAQAVKVLKTYLARYPKEHAIMFFEFIQGEGGFYSATKHFFETIMTILKEHKVAIFADEVQTFGRTSALFAFQYYGLERFIDIASIGKISQVCVTFYTEEYRPKPGLLSQTFTSSTSAIKASIAILKRLLNGGFYGPGGKIETVHDYFVSKLVALSKLHPDLIRGPYGVGSMIAFTPYDGDYQKVTDYVHRLFDAGVMSFTAGGNPLRVRFLVPVDVVTYEDIDQVVNIIEKTLLQKL